MDLIVLIVILLAGFLIKYLIDTISLLTNELKEMKSKCITVSSNDTLSVNTKNPVETFNTELINNIKYFKDYFDSQKLYK
jgi:FtsZ-binding cell division protein ZapB